MTDTVVWSKNNCIWCERAKNLLKQSGIPFEERNIQGDNWTKEQLFEAIPGVRTVPQIFMHGKYVGDFSALEQYYEDHNMNIGNQRI